MTQARLGYGTKLFLYDATGVTPAEIGEIVEGPDDEDTVELVEVTNHQSANRRREYIGALIDGGEVTFRVNYIPNHATHNVATGLRGLLGQTRKFRLETPGDTFAEEFDGIILNVGRTRPVAEAMQMSVSVKKAGDVTQVAI